MWGPAGALLQSALYILFTFTRAGRLQHGRTLVPLCIQRRQLRRRLVHEPELALGRVEETSAALTRALAATRVRPWAWVVDMGGPSLLRSILGTRRGALGDSGAQPCPTTAAGGHRAEPPASQAQASHYSSCGWPPTCATRPRAKGVDGVVGRAERVARDRARARSMPPERDLVPQQHVEPGQD